MESQGFSFHAWDDYWNEAVAYEFSESDIASIRQATAELHGMSLEAVDYVLKNEKLEQLKIPKAFWDSIYSSWGRREFSLYGRFDLAFNGIDPPKMLEYNADTPTSLLESAVVQKTWQEQVFPNKTQFNIIESVMVNHWKRYQQSETVYFASLRGNEEDQVCIDFIIKCAQAAGINTKWIAVEDIIWNGIAFLDQDRAVINHLFKLYPWEWMMIDEFGKYIKPSGINVIEPIWKSILSNKGILPVLWEMFPDHPNLLPAYYNSDQLSNYAKKPFFSREGANVELFSNNQKFAEDTGPYGSEGHVYQELFRLPCLDGNYPIIGSWVIGNDPAGIDVREDSLMITTNLSHFIPHVMG